MRKNIKFKENLPHKTVNKIRDIITDLGIITYEHWYNSQEDLYSVLLSISGIPATVAGKGVSHAFALGSAYGEFMESIQNQNIYNEYQIGSNIADHHGFFVAPDEKYTSKEEVLNDSSEWMKVLLPDYLDKNTKEKIIDQLISLTPEQAQGDLIAVPFYNVNDDEIYYLPNLFLEIFYMSNGMAAGNSPEETLVHAISEIAERYVNKRILQDNIVPPDIPESFLKSKYPRLYNIIRKITSDGRYKVRIKECSLGEGWPVAALILWDVKNKTYFVKFGAHPELEIAIERNLTELLQGRDINDMYGMTKYGYVDEEVVKSNDNIERIFYDGSGYYHTELFTDNYSYPFSEPKGIGDMENKEILQQLIELVKNKGFKIFVRDVSFLGFPGYHVIIPGMSEVKVSKVRLFERAVALKEARGIVKDLNNASHEEIKQVIRAIKIYGFSGLDSIVQLTGIPAKDNFLWNNIKIDLFLSAAYFKIGQIEKAHEAVERFINNIEKLNKVDENTEYLKCVKDFLKMRILNKMDDQIEMLLIPIYGKELVQAVISDFKHPDEIFKYYGKLNCWNCNECDFNNQCAYKELEKLHITIKEVYKNNPIDQLQNKSIFQF